MVAYLLEVASMKSHMSVEGGNILELPMAQVTLDWFLLLADRGRQERVDIVDRGRYSRSWGLLASCGTDGGFGGHCSAWDRLGDPMMAVLEQKMKGRLVSIQWENGLMVIPDICQQQFQYGIRVTGDAHWKANVVAMGMGINK